MPDLKSVSWHTLQPHQALIPFFRKNSFPKTTVFFLNVTAFCLKRGHVLKKRHHVSETFQPAKKKRRSTLTSSLILLMSCLQTGKSHSCNVPVSVSAPWSASHTSPRWYGTRTSPLPFLLPPHVATT